MSGTQLHGNPAACTEMPLAGRPDAAPAPAGALGLIFCLAWLAGSACQLQQRVLWPAWAYGTAGLAALGLWGLWGLGGWLALRGDRPGRRRSGPADAPSPPAPAIAGPRPRTAFRGTVRMLIAAASAALLGFGSAGWHGTARADRILPAGLEGADLQVVGVVSSLPKATAGGLRFVFEVESAQRDGQAVALPPQLALGWYSNRHSPGTGLSEPVKAGQRWSLPVRLKRPHGLMNPHGFDYELYLFEQGLGATGHVREDGARLLQARAGHGLQRLRQQVKDSIEAQVGDSRVAGVLAGLSVGDQSAIEREDWELFRATGVAHLMSISGLHVTMFAWLAGLLVQALWRRSARAPLRWPAPAAARWGGLLAALAYALFSGWGVPAQRTVWMLAAATLLQAHGRRWPWPLVLLAAAVVVTALDPWALLQPGFWLSFCAVGLLLASGVDAGSGVRLNPPPGGLDAHGAGFARRWAARLRQAAWLGIRTQVVATIGLAPLGLVFFQQLSVVGLLANLVAIPVVSFLLTPLALAGAALPLLWVPAAWLVQTLGAYLSLLASWPWATWTVAAAPAWAQCAALIGAALWVLPAPWRLRLLALPLCLPLCIPVLHRPGPGQFDLLAADVGQGTAVLVRTQNHLLLFDSGPQYSAESDAGQRVLLPLLQALGERRIDLLVLSHSDTDHVGGAPVLLSRFPISAMASSLPSPHPLQEQARLRGVPSRRCAAGQSWRWDGVEFLVLQPEADDYARLLRPNAMSCVVQVRAGSGAAGALLTGDIERGQEARLVQTHGDALRSKVLVVPHHGSKTSSTADFLSSVQAEVAVVQSGYRNRFGHPAPEVMRRLLRNTEGVKTSPSCGAWRWSSQDAVDQPQGRCWRQEARRYWHHPGADSTSAANAAGEGGAPSADKP